MGKQCDKCNAFAEGDGPNCLACGAPFGPVPSPARARRTLAWITAAVVVPFLLLLVWMKASRKVGSVPTNTLPSAVMATTVAFCASAARIATGMTGNRHLNVDVFP